ncbi:hypothetical protein EV122DRAFT_225067 [Schizophyllum commune]
MPLLVLRVLLALRYLGYLLALPHDHFAQLALEGSFRLARRGRSSWVSDLRHVLVDYLPLHLHPYDRLHDTSALATTQTELGREADDALAAEHGPMPRLDLWNARGGGKVHALLDFRGRVDLISMRRTLFEDMLRMNVRAPAFDGFYWGRSFLCWLTEHKRYDVRAAWAHYVYRVLGVFPSLSRALTPFTVTKNLCCGIFFCLCIFFFSFAQQVTT